jgi:hypothetical protein
MFYSDILGLCNFNLWDSTNSCQFGILVGMIVQPAMIGESLQRACWPAEYQT